MATEVMREVAIPAVAFRSWSAVDLDAEERIDRDVRRPATRGQVLMRWLIEFNKY